MLTWTAFLTLMLSISCHSWFISKENQISEDFQLKDAGKLWKFEGLEQPNCTDDKFLQVLAHFRIASPEDLFILAMKADEAQLCRDLTVGTDRIMQYLKHCMTTPSQDLYLKLLSGLGALKDKVCDDKKYKKLYKRNAECYNVIRYEMGSCRGPQDWLEIKNTSEFCNIMKSVLGCYYTKTMLNCGLMAAEVFSDLMKCIMSSLSDDYCPNIVKENFVRDLRSLTPSRGPVSISKPTMLLPLICCLIVLIV